ncbi:hypothetical protein PF586_08835 [Lactobacillus delbrueckii]|uniref:Uncharacterized protein n=1 Tax=Lactobacillus delbrueckii TaxID=1584 RepID=A0AAW5YWT4_9LACO|nr:hypothetical protein [Lactobacillus delbrueckii]MCT2879233.1 hypothetical protein [Lactobacillus delbrueckii]MCT3492265.1 hypothetical protein [Lactobacillus delbrueckii]MDA3768534.1 hypothetical protein [Lactobacillus delbrueckii]
MQHLKERAISAYPPKSRRWWTICIAVAIIIGLLFSHFGQAKFGASLADFALLCRIDLLAVTFAKHGVNIFLAYLLATVLYFIVTIPLTFYIMSSNNL